MPELVVELYGVQVGVLREERSVFDFIATSDALRTFGIDSLILSVAAPLTQPRPKLTRRHAEDRPGLPAA